jgi:Tfp pilus assembly protein FimV
VDRVGGNGGDEAAVAEAKALAKAPRKLTDEETLAVQLLQARTALAQRGKRMAELEQRCAALINENMQLSAQVEDVQSRELSAKYGFPTSFAIERKDDGLYVK